MSRYKCMKYEDIMSKLKQRFSLNFVGQCPTPPPYFMGIILIIYKVAKLDNSSVHQRYARPVSWYKCMKYEDIMSKLKHDLIFILSGNVHPNNSWISNI